MKNILKKPEACTKDSVSPLNLEKFPGEKQYVVEDCAFLLTFGILGTNGQQWNEQNNTEKNFIWEPCLYTYIYIFSPSLQELYISK